MVVGEEESIWRPSSTPVLGKPSALGGYLLAVGNDFADSRTDESELLFFQWVVSFGSKAKGKYWQCIMDNKPHDLLHPLTYDKVITNSLQKLIQLFFDIQCKFFPSMNPFFASSTTQSEFLPILPPRLSWRAPNCCLFHLYEISLMITC